jgi:iron complex transport system permease protein
LLVLGLLALAAATLRLLVTPGLEGGWTLAWPSHDIAWIRWKSLAMGPTVGVSLSVSGVLLQALMRNPLASPYILGISAGAALGVMVAGFIAHRAGGESVRHGSHLVPSLLGAVAVLVLVYALSQRRGFLDPVTLVLVGVIISSMCGALIMLLQHLVPAGLHTDLVRWMMGSIRPTTPNVTLGVAGGLAAVGLGIGMWLGRAMDVATLGDDEARSAGLEIGSLRIWMFLLAGVLASCAVALCGPIGFVGLVAPHAARLAVGPKHTTLVLGASLAGVVLVVGADAGRQAIDLGSGAMPIGVFTSLIGGPAFIWLLLSGRGRA